MSSVLEGEQILFAAEQFDRQALELLTAKATVCADSLHSDWGWVECRD
jgi:hypothetical protein